MEIRKEKIRVNRIGKTTTSQFVVEDGYNVPDNKPDVGRVVTSEGHVRIDSVKPADSYLKISGKLHFKILYVTDSAVPSFASMEGALPVEEMIYVEEGSEEDYQVQVSRLHLNVSVIHSRKLDVKAIAEFAVHKEKTEEETVSVGTEAQGRVFQKTRQEEILELCDNRRDIYRVKEEIKIPGTKETIENLLWEETVLRSLDTKLANDNLQLNGELSVFFIYQSAEGKVQWVEQSVPFEGQISCGGVDGSYYHHVYRTLQDTNLEVRMDEDGEMRCLGVEAVLELRVLIYKEENMELLEDVYSLDENCDNKMRHVFLEELVTQNHSKCRVAEEIEVPEVGNEILQICHSGGEIQVEKMETAEGGIQIEGILHVHFLYVKESDQTPFDVWSGMVPFSYLMECENSGIDLNYDITYGLEQLAVELSGNGSVEIKAYLSFKSFVRKPVNMEMVDTVECCEIDEKALCEQPGIVGYIVKEEEELWNLAKRYGTTEDSIMEINNLSSKELKTGDKLLIFKENMSIL